MNKKTYILGTLVLLSLVAIGVTYAAFSDKGKVLGSTFSIGSGDIKLLRDIASGIQEENLADDISGPSFSDIGPNWEARYNLKVFNNATSPVTVSTNANYDTANDPDELRQIIYIEPLEWNDINEDGLVDSNEEGVSLGKKTIVKWKTEGFFLGQINSGEIKSLILIFSTESIPSSKQGASAIFDFVIDAIQIE